MSVLNQIGIRPAQTGTLRGQKCIPKSNYLSIFIQRIKMYTPKCFFFLCLSLYRECYNMFVSSYSGLIKIIGRIILGKISQIHTS